MLKKLKQISNKLFNFSPTVGTLLGDATELSGDLYFQGGIHINGYIQGNVFAKEDQSALLSLGPKACIEGDVHVPHILINGKVKGNIYASKYVTLSPEAKVEGNVYYKQIEILAGAKITGNLVPQNFDQQYALRDKNMPPEKATPQETATKKTADSKGKVLNIHHAKK